MADTNTQTSTPIVSGDHQLEVLAKKRQECETKIAASVKHEPSEGGEWCSAAWDGILCWGRVPAGQMSSQPCPGYVVGSQTQAEATRRCLDDGRWFVHNNTGLTWTNYSMCFPEIDATVVMDFPGATNVTVMENYVPVVKAIARAGYAVSLASLVVAFCILAAVKKLRCPRNILHMHLFLSFIMRAFMAILKDSLFVMGLGLSSDIVVKTEGTYFSSEDEENWECKLITSLWQYFIMANYSWILMEGLYLHNLIFLALFSDTSSISLYVILGWGLPAVCVLSWVACRVVLEDTLCWTTNQSASLFLLIRVPTTLSIILNFILFVNIVRVLLLKLRSTVCEETRRFRRWAKSTLVLVPLFGVHYSVFLGLSYSMGIDPDVELAWLFCDQLFASFQGFFVAVLYCFMNGEVRTELSKKWRRAPWGGRNECGRLSASGRSLSIIPGRHNQPRASCYSSTSCTSLSIGGAPSFGSSWLLNKRRSGSVQDAPRPGHTFGESGNVSYYSNLSEMGSRIANGQDRRWSKSDYNVMGSVL